MYSSASAAHGHHSAINPSQTLHMPANVICADFASSMPVGGVFQLYEEMNMKGFKGELTVVEGSDHCPMLQKPEDFSNIIMAELIALIIGISILSALIKRLCDSSFILDGIEAIIDYASARCFIASPPHPCNPLLRIYPRR